MSETSLLLQLVTEGAGPVTAHGTPGLAYSEQQARADLPRLVERAAAIHQAADEAGLPAALLAALASRESGAGRYLDADGKGDGGNAFGDVQVDYRFHGPDESEGPAGLAHYQQAAGILVDDWTAVATKHPEWESAWQLRGAVAAYNSGVGNVATQEGLDQGTTGDDYSSDVWARARWLLDAFPDTEPVTEAPRRRWPWIVGGLLAAAAVALVAWLTHE